MKQHLLNLLSKVPGNGAWAINIRRHLTGPKTDTMLAELQCAALDNGAYMQNLIGKEAYELLLEMEFGKAEVL